MVVHVNVLTVDWLVVVCWCDGAHISRRCHVLQLLVKDTLSMCVFWTDIVFLIHYLCIIHHFIVEVLVGHLCQVLWATEHLVVKWQRLRVEEGWLAWVLVLAALILVACPNLVLGVL